MVVHRPRKHVIIFAINGLTKRSIDAPVKRRAEAVAGSSVPDCSRGTLNSTVNKHPFTGPHYENASPHTPFFREIHHHWELLVVTRSTVGKIDSSVRVCSQPRRIGIAKLFFSK